MCYKFMTLYSILEPLNNFSDLSMHDICHLTQQTEGNKNNHNNKLYCTVSE
jgi:hypothetical protein